jgi:hypothetical protein
MNLRQRKIPEHKAKILAEVLLQQFDHRISFSAVWALVIAVLDKCDQGFRIALDMVVGRDWNFQIRHCDTSRE